MMNTKPKERELVKFFDEYTLHASEDDKDPRTSLDLDESLF
jgi:hypothetical protein